MSTAARWSCTQEKSGRVCEEGVGKQGSVLADVYVWTGRQVCM